MEKTNMLLWAGTILALLCILSMTTTEGFYRSNTTAGANRAGGSPPSNATGGAAATRGARTGATMRATRGAATGMAGTMTDASGTSIIMPAAAIITPTTVTTVLPTTQTISSANAAPTISSLSTASPAPAIPSAPLGTQNTVSASRTTPGTPAVNVVNGSAPNSAPLSALTNGINNGANAVAAATTAGVPIAPGIGNVQQQTAPGAGAAAATIQAPRRGAGLSPSGLPSDLQSAIDTYMPTNLTFRPPASILMGAPQMGVPQVAAAPINASGTMGDMQMGMRPVPRRKRRDDVCCSPSDDCNDDCSDNCNE